MGLTSYHAQISFTVGEDLILPHASQVGHIFWEQQGLLHSWGNMAPNAPVEVPKWCIIPQGLPVVHGCWKPGSWLWRLKVWSLQDPLWCMADLLLLRSSLGLVFSGQTGSSYINHVFPFLLPFPFGSAGSGLIGWGWWGAGEGDLGRGGNLRLCKFPRCTFSRLIFYQLH